MSEMPVLGLFSLDPPVSRPGGGEFKFWRNETEFIRTYHVDGWSPKAADDGPGTAFRARRSGRSRFARGTTG